MSWWGLVAGNARKGETDTGFPGAAVTDADELGDIIPCWAGHRECGRAWRGNIGSIPEQSLLGALIAVQEDYINGILLRESQ